MGHTVITAIQGLTKSLTTLFYGWGNCCPEGLSYLPKILWLELDPGSVTPEGNLLTLRIECHPERMQVFLLLEKQCMCLWVCSDGIKQEAWVIYWPHFRLFVICLMVKMSDLHETSALCFTQGERQVDLKEDSMDL